jgi:DNA-binding NarL/FixJ family response regulator
MALSNNNRKPALRRKDNHIRVLIVGSDDSARKGITDALTGEDEINIEGHASNASELENYINKLTPNIVIVNDQGKGISSLEAISLINKKINNLTKILFLINDYDEDLELAALRMGVRGFLPKSVAKADLIKCIKAINSGEMWVRRRVMQKLIDQLLKKVGGS